MAKKKENQSKAVKWDYSPAPESSSHINMKDQYELFIGGKWVKPSSGKYFDTINPANKKKLAKIAYANEKDVDKAVKAARKAYKTVWSKTAPAERAKYWFRFGSSSLANDVLMQIMKAETGVYQSTNYFSKD